MTAAHSLRVGIDGTPLLGQRTGVGAFVSGALGALAARDDVDPVVYALSFRGRGALVGRVPSTATVVERPMAARPLRAVWARSPRPPIEWWTGPLDVVHATNFVAPPTRRAGVVVSVHDLTPVRFPELCTPDTRRYPDLVRRAAARGAMIHTHTTFGAAEVVDVLAVPAERVVAVAPGIPPLGPRGDPAGGRALAGASRYVLALGTVEPRKDLPSLVAAFAAVAGADADVRLVVAGPDGWGAEALGEAIARSSARSRIVRLGWVTDAQRADLLAGATLLAYPSRYEGFGFPPLEAMTAGVPVVATAAGPVPEVVGDGARLVPVGDVDALGEALASLLADSSARHALVERGRTRAATFSWQHCAAGLTALYRMACDLHPARR